jgi:hypothetical protein
MMTCQTLTELLLPSPSFINIANRVKGIDIIDVIISSVRTDVGSIGKPHIGKNGIGNKISSQIPIRKAIIFHLCLSLESINTL